MNANISDFASSCRGGELPGAIIRGGFLGRPSSDPWDYLWGYYLEGFQRAASLRQERLSFSSIAIPKKINKKNRQVGFK